MAGKNGMKEAWRGGKKTRRGEAPIHRKLHLLLIIRDRTMNLLQLQPQLRGHGPPQTTAQQARAKIILPVLGIPYHDGEILRHILQQDMQRMHRLLNHSLVAQNPVPEHGTSSLVKVEREILRVPRAEELQRHLHYLLGAELATGEIIQDFLAVIAEELFTLCDALRVRPLQLEPPVRLHSGERHGLMVCPAEGTVGSRESGLDFEGMVRGRESDAAQFGVVGEGAEGLDFGQGDASGCVG